MQNVQLSLGYATTIATDHLRYLADEITAQAPTPSAYGAVEKKEEDNDDDERFQDPENEVGLFATGAYDRDDDEADRIYQDIDERMDRRRKARRLVRPTPFRPYLIPYLCL